MLARDFSSTYTPYLWSSALPAGVFQFCKMKPKPKLVTDEATCLFSILMYVLLRMLTLSSIVPQLSLRLMKQRNSTTLKDGAVDHSRETFRVPPISRNRGSPDRARLKPNRLSCFNERRQRAKTPVPASTPAPIKVSASNDQVCRKAILYLHRTTRPVCGYIPVSMKKSGHCVLAAF